MDDILGDNGSYILKYGSEAIMIQMRNYNKYNLRNFSFQVQVATTGWFLIALTFRGSLIGADFIIGWVSPEGTASIIVSCKEFIREGGAIAEWSKALI